MSRIRCKRDKPWPKEGQGSGTTDTGKEKPGLKDKSQRLTQLPVRLCLWLTLLLNT